MDYAEDSNQHDEQTLDEQLDTLELENAEAPAGEQDELLKPIQVLRFEDLKRAGICKDWSGLKYLIDRCGFPPGFVLGARSRAWMADTVSAWLKARPKYSKPERLRGIARRNAARAALKRELSA